MHLNNPKHEVWNVQHLMRSWSNVMVQMVHDGPKW